jgi:hypothetical protein
MKEEIAAKSLNGIWNNFLNLCNGKSFYKTTGRVRSHAIFYEIRQDKIEIICILHKSMDFIKHL